MSVYTVHAPPLSADEAAVDPQRFMFVRDGFSVWAFLLGALWMLWHRMWLVLILYLVIAGGGETAMRFAGTPTPILVLAGFLVAMLVGLEAGTQRRFTLHRRGWKTIGTVSGNTLEEAERRFYDAWIRDARVTAAGPLPGASPIPPPPPLSPRVPPPGPGVIGLFPEPEASR